MLLSNKIAFSHSSASSFAIHFPEKKTANILKDKTSTLRLEMITWTSHKICLITFRVYYSRLSLIFSSKGEGGERRGNRLLKHTLEVKDCICNILKRIKKGKSKESTPLCYQQPRLSKTRLSSPKSTHCISTRARFTLAERLSPLESC